VEEESEIRERGGEEERKEWDRRLDPNVLDRSTPPVAACLECTAVQNYLSGFMYSSIRQQPARDVAMNEQRKSDIDRR
jgi:hypothetical protein